MKKKEILKSLTTKRKTIVEDKDILKLAKIVKNMNDKDFKKNASIELIVNKKNEEPIWYSAERINKHEWRTKICGLNVQKMTLSKKELDMNSFNGAIDIAVLTVKELMDSNELKN